MHMNKLHLGLDVDTDSIAHPGRQGEIRLHSSITHDLHAPKTDLVRIRNPNPSVRRA